MKNILFGAVAIMVMASSCKKKPEYCIDGPTQVLPGSTHTYTYCGDDDYDEIEWQFNGEYYTTKSIEITFPEYAGTHHISLDVTRKTWGVKRSADSGNGFKVSASYGTNPPLILRAKDYLYDRGIVGNIGIANASVKIYTSKTCWQNEDTSESCLVAEGTTDGKGKLIIEGLDVDLAYVVEIQTENSLNNWSNNVREMEIRDWAYDDSYGGYRGNYTEDYPLDVYMRYSPMSHLIKASQWKITDFKLNGTSQWTSISDCSKDNYLTFDRDLNWNYSEGADVCTTSTESSGTFDWINNQGSNSEFLEDYYVSMATTSGTAEFNGGSINVTGKKLTITSSVGPNTVESIFTRVE